MAVYHLSVKSGKNETSSGTRGSNHFAYISREGKYKRDDLQVTVTGNLPNWAKDANHFWKSADKYERANGRVYTELEISIPRELNPEQQQVLVQQFVKNTLGEHHTYSYAIHCPIASDGQSNPHAHIMFCERRLDGIERTEKQFFKRYNPKNPELGGAGKDRIFNARNFVHMVRESWANTANDYMQKLGLDARIDHRSYKSLGVEITSQNYRPEYLGNFEYKVHGGIADIKRQNGEIIIERPSEVLKVLTATQSVFTINELDRYLSAHTDGEEQYLQAREAVLKSPEMAVLYDRHGVVFSSQEMVTIEHSINALIYNANETSRKAQSDQNQTLKHQAFKVEQSRTFNPEQAQAFKNLTQTNRISLVNGSAGTGKSYVLSAVSESFQNSGYNVQGIALQAITAQAIADDCGVPSRTIASFIASYESGNLEINEKSVLILDEAGMVGSRDMQKLLLIAEQHNAQIKMVGDSYQLSAVSAGNAFAQIQRTLDQNNQTSLVAIQRQRDETMREASKALSRHNIDEALEIYNKLGAIKEHQSHEMALMNTIKSWEADPTDSKLMLAHSNSDVNALNSMARKIMIEQNKLGESHSIQNYKGEMQIATGDQIVFKQNSKQLGVANGEVAKVVELKFDEHQNIVGFTAQKPKSADLIQVDLKDYNHIRHGYANTIHSSQGMTVENAYVLASQHMNANLTYVALTRHKGNVELNFSQSDFNQEQIRKVRQEDGSYKTVELTAFDNLKQNLSRGEVKKFSTDYSVAEAKDKLINAYIQDHRKTIADERLRDQGLNREFSVISTPHQNLSKAEIHQEIRSHLKHNSILGEDYGSYKGLAIAKGESLKLDESFTVKTGLFKREELAKGTELKVMNVYQEKGKPMMSAIVNGKDLEIPLKDIQLSYSDRYIQDYKNATSARIDHRVKSEVLAKFNEKMNAQIENQPKLKNSTPDIKIDAPKSGQKLRF